MSRPIATKITSSLLAIFAGYSFLSFAQSDEKNLRGCESRLTDSWPLQARVAAEIPQLGSSSIHLRQVGDRLFLAMVDKYGGTVKLYEPLQSAIPVGTWTDVSIANDQIPRWVDLDVEARLLLGTDALAIDLKQPSRVRIMPVGKIVDDGDSALSVFVTDDNVLHFEFKDGVRAPMAIPLAMRSTQTPQVVQGKHGEVFVLIGNSENSSILEFKNGKMSPVAVVRKSFMFTVGDRSPVVLWSAMGPLGRSTLQFAKLKTLSTPELSVTLDPLEIIKNYDSLTVSSTESIVAILTSRRVLLIRLDTRQLNSDQGQ